MSKSLSIKLRGAANKITNVVMNYSDIEAKVRIATNKETWGPSGSLMQELAQCTFTDGGYQEVMGMVWYRLFVEGGNKWRNYYKTFILLDYLLWYGSVDVVNNIRAQSGKILRFLQYTSHGKRHKDHGLNVRNMAREVMCFAGNIERLREERRRAQASRNNYVGLSYRDVGFDRVCAGERSSGMKGVK